MSNSPEIDCNCDELISDTKDLSKGTCKNCGKKFQLVKDSPRGLLGIAWEEIVDTDNVGGLS